MWLSIKMAAQPTASGNLAETHPDSPTIATGPDFTPPNDTTNSSGARLDLADARFHEARDLVLDLGMVPQPALELVRDGARAHLRADG